MPLNGENSSEASRLLQLVQSDYQSRDDYDWNVEIDVKGQVNTGPEEEFTGFSFKKLLQYTGPGKRETIYCVHVHVTNDVRDRLAHVNIADK